MGDDLLVNPEDYELYRRVRDDGRTITVVPLTFGRARLHIQPHPESLLYDDGW